MAYYLVDYENVKADGMCGVDELGKKDYVCIFYSENASTLTFGLHESLNRSKAKIVLQKVEVGVKNALDFQLSTYLGYLISENEGKNETYYIVSEDKGLAILTGYWAERGEQVKTAPDIAAAKADQEEEKPAKAEKEAKKVKEEKAEKPEKETAAKKEEKEKRQQKKSQRNKHSRKENGQQMQTTRLQVHTRKQEEKPQDSIAEPQKVEKKEVPVAEENLSETVQENQVQEVAESQTGDNVRKPAHRRYRRYNNYRKYPQKNRKNQESTKVIRPILSAGK